MTTHDQSTVEANASTIETFLISYLMDVGIGVQLTEMLAKQFTDPDGRVLGSVDVKALFSSAVQDVLDVPMFGGAPECNISRVIAGAPSFEFLVRSARMLDEHIMPRDVIPSDEVVSAALRLFHEAKQSTTVGS